MRYFFAAAVLPVMIWAATVMDLPAPAPRPADLSSLPPLEVGDWVLRMGTVGDSRLIRHLGGGDYSHIGMVVVTEPQIMVIHATTDDGTTLRDQVELTPLSAFFSPDLARDHAVIRPLFLNPVQKQAIAARLSARRGEKFVLAARDRSPLYCTTLLADEIRRSAPAFAPRWQQVNAPLFEGEYLFPRAFAEYRPVRTVYRSH